MAINLSSSRLRDPGVVGTLLDELFAAGISARQVTIEILESTLLDDRCELASSNIRALAEAGFRIELDDFGTGHTAIASLREFPVHQIKIDRSLVRNIDREDTSRAIVEGLFLLATRIGIGVIAEGVETQGEIDALRRMGVDKFQGYAIARPMAGVELLRWLELAECDGA